MEPLDFLPQEVAVVPHEHLKQPVASPFHHQKTLRNTGSEETCTITFCVQGELIEEHRVHVVGRLLGEAWDHTNSFPLVPSGEGGADRPVWTGSVAVPVGTPFEYRYIAYDESTPFCCLSQIKRILPQGTKNFINDGDFGELFLSDTVSEPRSQLRIRIGYTRNTVTKEGSPQLGITLHSQASQQVDQASQQANQIEKVVVSAKGALWMPSTVLPHDSDEPVIFSFGALEDISTVHFDILSRSSSSIGSAVILASQLVPANHGIATLPIVSSGSRDVIGEITFQYLLVTPFTHPQLLTAPATSCMPPPKGPLLIGHRGSGSEKSRKNVDGNIRSHIRENTVLSFNSAASSGAQFVEFDVHLTSDLVPVIYHDFVIASSGITTPVHTISLEQFKKIGRRMIKKCSSLVDMRQNQSAGDIIADSFPTLREVLKETHQSTGFNIEIKYPSKEEADRLDLHVVDRNTYLDCILWAVFECAKSRTIVFSSFDPDICVLLAEKQSRYPVFFLSEIGASLRLDPRSNSVDASVQFAKSANLNGLVCPAKYLLSHPDLIPRIKGSGLDLWTWGRENNSPEHVHFQKKAGVDGIIADHVAHIAKNWDH